MLKIIKIFLIFLVSTSVVTEASGTVKVKDIEKIKKAIINMMKMASA